MSTLRGHVAIVTGASRGAGRAIALELGEAGATVYVTGRSTRARPSPDGMVGTIEETAQSVNSRGGRGIAVRCDHTVDADTEALFDQVRREQGRLDLLVNNAWAGGPQTSSFWELPLSQWTLNVDVCARAALAASRLAAPLMIANKRGLIVNTTYADRGRFTANVYYDVGMNAMCRLAFGMALDLKPHGVTALALSPGFMRTERVLAAFGVDETKSASVEALRGSETPHYIGRAVKALASDVEVMRWSGQTLLTGELARVYNFTDLDGSQPAPFLASMGTRGT
jgi:NAD(P)-dependent dehydrogenase (short-subunit alcohol dehydrogenase family)